LAVTAVDEAILSLLLDDQARSLFAKDPRTWLRKAGVAADTARSAPASLVKADIDLAALKAAVELSKRGVPTDPQVLREPPGRRIAVRELQKMRAEASRAAESTAPSNSPMVVTTPISIVVLVVAVVTGISQNRDRGDLQISREGGSLVVRGPLGIKLEGLSVNDAAQLIKSLR
jgi:hypothetical protein